MANYSYKDLGIHFTKSFDVIWCNNSAPYNLSNGRWEPRDATTIGLQKVTFWRPRIDTYVPKYYRLGDCAFPHFSDIHWKNLVPIVTDLNGPDGTALRAPLRFYRVWSNQPDNTTESILRIVSIWRPIAPDGYVALGLAAGIGFQPPDIDAFRCVRKDLVIESPAGKCLWEEKETGTPKEFSAWDITPPSARPEEVYLSAGTFLGTTNYRRPHNNPNAYALRISIPSTVSSPPPPLPTLNGHFKPTFQDTNPATYITKLPWFTVTDPSFGALQQLFHSPIYTLERTDSYRLIGYSYNNTSISQRQIWSVTTGSNGHSATTLSGTTSIEMGTEWTVPLSGFKVSAKLGLSFTYSHLSSEGWSKSNTFSVWTDIPPQKSVAAYIINSTYRLLRQDGTQLGESISYTDETSCCWDEFPPGDACTVTTQSIPS